MADDSRRMRTLEKLEQRQLMTADLAAGVAGPFAESAFAAPLEAQQPFAANGLAADASLPLLGGTGQAVLAEAPIVTIDLPDELPERLVVPIEVNGQTLTLQLERFSVRSENFRIRLANADGTLTEVDAGVDRTYQGSIVEQPEIRIAAIVTPDGLQVFAYDNLTDQPIWELVSSESATGYSLVTPAGAAAVTHDHDGDGIPDHGDRNHDDGCCCDDCLAAQGLVAPAFASATIAAPRFDATPTDTSPEQPPLRAVNDAVLLNPVQVREAEIAFDVASTVFINRFNSNVAQVQAAIDAFLVEIVQEIWTRDALIQHTLGEVIIRTDPSTDPYVPFNGLGGASAGGDRLDLFRDIWNTGEFGNTHDLGHLLADTVGGGLAFVNDAAGNDPNRYSQAGVSSVGSWRGFARHEIGHNWGLNHSDASPQFRIPNDATGEATGSPFGIMANDAPDGLGPNQFALAPNELVIVEARRDAVLSTLAPINLDNADNIRPYARIDDFDVLGSGTFVLDVLSNDHDANNDALFLSGVGPRFNTGVFTLPSGSTVSIGNGLGDQGQDVVLYTPAAGVTEETFFYRANDGNLDNFAQVTVSVEDSDIFLNPQETFFSFDPGTADSPIFNNAGGPAIRLTPNSSGDVAWSPGVQAFDRGVGTGNAFNRDLITGTDTATFTAQIRPGRWQVLLNLTDPEFDLDNLFIRAEGETTLSDIDRPIGENDNLLFEVDVLDGELNLEFGDADTVDPRWAVTRINLILVEGFDPPVLAGDYNDDGVVDAADYTVWRDSFNQSVSTPFDGADGNGNGVIDLGDRDLWFSNFGDRVVTAPLIDATTGNGEFAVDSEAEAEAINGGSEPLEFALNRDRVLRQTTTPGRGIAINGWQITRVSYPGGNAALGFDGVIGLAPNPESGTGPGQSGQAFVNSGAVDVASDPVVRDFVAGDVLDLSYELGTDTANATVQATVEVILDAGLPTERLAADPVVRNVSGLSTPAFNEQIPLFGPASSVTVRFRLDGGAIGNRTLLDSVGLNLTTTESRLASSGASSSLTAAPAAALQAATPQTATRTTRTFTRSETFAIEADEPIAAAAPIAAASIEQAPEAPAPTPAEIQGIAIANRGAPATSASTAASRDLALAGQATNTELLDLLYTDAITDPAEDDSTPVGDSPEADPVDSAFDEFGLDEPFTTI